jgi:TolB-like protein
MLAYLALTPEQRHSREKLAAFLWEDRSDEQARTSLRQTLAVLRKAIPSADRPWLSANSDWVALDLEAVQVDVEAFEDLAKQATPQSLAQASDLYRGDLLLGFNIRGESFSDWLRAERDRLRRRALQVLSALLVLQSEGSDVHAGVATAHRLLSLDPLDEGARRTLMRLYVANGRRDVALQQYEILRNHLQRELNVDPEPETRSLHQQILTHRLIFPGAATTTSGSPTISPMSPANSRRSISTKPVVVILPFANQSGVAAQVYLSDGISEDIITELSRYHSLLVIARSSSFKFGRQRADIAILRRKLGARYIVEGSIRRLGPSIRVTVQLVDADTEGHLWAERYDRPIEEIFAVQTEVAAAIAATLEGRIVAHGAEFVRKKPMKDWDAYDNFLKGRELIYHHKSIEAEPYFLRAVTLNPDYVQAHAWRSIALTVNYTIDGLRNPSIINEAVRSAQRALELDDTDASSHHAMGYACLKRRLFQLAGLHFDRAFNLNPNDVSIAGDRANWLNFVGRSEEALQCLDLAMERDPYPPAWVWEVRGTVLYDLRRYDEAIAAYLKVGEEPYWMPALLAAAYAQAGQLENARRQLAQLQSIRPDVTLDTFATLAIYEDRRLTDHFLDGLRKAGMSD